MKISNEKEMEANISCLGELCKWKIYKPYGKRDRVYEAMYKLNREQKAALLHFLYGAMGSDPRFITMLKKGIKLGQDVYKHYK